MARQGRWPCALPGTTVGFYPRSASPSCSRPPGAAQSRGGDMRRYEVMLILDPGLEDKDAKAAVDKFLTTVSSRGGEIKNIDHWGKRRFAYEIRHINEGYYTVVVLEAEPTAVDELSRVLGLADEVVRPEAAWSADWQRLLPRWPAGPRLPAPRCRVPDRSAARSTGSCPAACRRGMCDEVFFEWLPITK